MREKRDCKENEEGNDRETRNGQRHEQREYRNDQVAKQVDV